MNAEEWEIRIREFSAMTGVTPQRLIEIAVEDGSMWPQTGDELLAKFHLNPL